jgi:hypothetical protein
MRRYVVGALLVCGFSLTVGPVGALTPAIRVVPRRHLVDGQTVTVTWVRARHARRAAPTLTIAECSRSLTYSTISAAAVASSCDADTAVVVPLAPTGSTQMTVATGVIDSNGDTCGTTSSDRRSCEIASYAFYSDGRLVPDTFGLFTIAFAPIG